MSPRNDDIEVALHLLAGLDARLAKVTLVLEKQVHVLEHLVGAAPHSGQDATVAVLKEIKNIKGELVRPKVVKYGDDGEAASVDGRPVQRDVEGRIVSIG